MQKRNNALNKVSQKKSSKKTEKAHKKNHEIHIKNHDKHVKNRNHFQLNELIRKVSLTHAISLEKLSLDQIKFFRSNVRTFLGTQQPTIRVRTSFTSLVTSGTNLTQVVAMDVTGITAWSSFANIFDEYRVKHANLHIQQLYAGYGASATSIAAMPVIVVVDYDDATAIASLANAIQYDTSKIVYLGGANPKHHSAKPAQPEGQPDLAWVTTQTPTVPFWWKFWSLSNLVPSSSGVGFCYIEAEIEFRQIA